MAPSAHVMFTLPAVILVESLVALVLAWRGRRIDDHPVCGRCGFDLVGLPAGSSACSECGADLSRPGAIRRGNRCRRIGALRTALLPLVLSVTWLTAMGWVTVRGTDVNRFKPYWLLRADAVAPDSREQRMALSELLRRFGAGRFDQAQMTQVVSDALRIQSDFARPWQPAWGYIIERAREWAVVSDAQWEQYLIRGIESALELEARHRSDPKRPLELILIENPARVGKAVVLDFEPGLKIDGHDIHLSQWSWIPESWSPWFTLDTGIRPKGWQRARAIIPSEATETLRTRAPEAELMLLVGATRPSAGHFRNHPPVRITLRCAIEPAARSPATSASR